MLILWPMVGFGGEREEREEKGEVKWKSEMGKLDKPPPPTDTQPSTRG